jgi:hypothetical protein
VLVGGVVQTLSARRPWRRTVRMEILVHLGTPSRRLQRLRTSGNRFRHPV